MTRAETNEANMSDTELEPSDTQTTSDVVPAKIAVVLLTDLENWQKLNVTAFTISGVASQEGAVGEDSPDASGDGKGVVKGKRVSVRVDIGGSRLIKDKQRANSRTVEQR